VDGDYAVGGSGKTVEIDESFIGRGMLLEEAEQSDHRRWRYQNRSRLHQGTARSVERQFSPERTQ